jgi:hypothetical protein
MKRNIEKKVREIKTREFFFFRKSREENLYASTRKEREKGKEKKN